MLTVLFKKCKQQQIVRKKQTADAAAFNSDTPVDSVVIVYPVGIDYDEEWWQHTPFPESNSHG